ncbi:MAG TPA: type II secretion system secretin GspD [Kofleriaceae bacterium]|nr:type II secretion system secretin GspD [Kofleriaceae bacterium]
MWHRPAPAVLAIFVHVLALASSAHPALADARRPDPEHPVAAPAAGAEIDEVLYSCKQGKAPVAITLKPETDVKDLITWVMSFTCKRFALDPRIVSTGKKVTLIAPNTLTPAEAYRMFLVALSTINLTVVPKGPVYRIVEASAARKETVPLLGRGLPDDTDQVARYVYRPSYAQAETIKQAFGALKSDAGEVQVIGTILLVTDYASHLRDMMSLAKLIDVPGGTEGVYTIPVRHADALKLAPKLEGFLGIAASAGAGPAAAARSRPDGAPAQAAEIAAVPSKIMVDERTNTLVLASSEAGYLRVKALVERLDIPLDLEGGATFHVYRLGSAIAEELAATLNQAIQGTAPARAPQAQGGQAPAAPAAPAVPADLGASLEGPVRVIGDKPSNSLIVMSSGRDFLALRNIIRELDLPRRQVYIEALILEVAVGDGREVGTSSHGSLPVGGGVGVGIGGVQTSTLSSLDPRTLAGASGLVGGLVGSSTRFFGTTLPSYGVLFQALADTSNTNVVSAPSIIALDNEEAKYKVGTNVPYEKATVFTGLTGGDAPPGGRQTSYERRDLLLQLAIKPHISTDETLLLEVKHEAEELQGSSGPGGPTWSTRAIETRVVVRDQQTVVIGGLFQEREVEETRKVPLLGDLPLLGYLFKHESKTRRKTNLVILLTPYIVKDQLDLQAIRERRLREHEEFTRSFHALSAMRYAPDVDYRRKRGLIEEINRSLLDVEADLAARASLREPPRVAPGVVETASAKD